MRIIVARPPTDVEAKSRPADVEEKTGTIQAGIAAVGTTQLIDANEETGQVTAIVGVTGIVDHVDDLIVPGAYKKTLAKRRPKVCFNHSWNDPIGRVVGIEEWLPGDPRFAEVGVTLDGKAWPAEAGALVATMEFNTKSERAKDAYATVVFFSESGECEWSIGWNPVSGKAFKRKDGVRVCAEVELFEVSPVLFGAAPLTRTLSLKDARELMVERKSLQVEEKARGRELPSVNFDESKHPRDRAGRFLEKGGQVRIWGTQKRGRIIDTGGKNGRMTVQLYGESKPRKLPKGLLLANDDVLVTRMVQLPGGTGLAQSFAVGWVDPADKDAMADAQLREIDHPSINRALGTPRQRERERRATEREHERRLADAEREREERAAFEAEHAELIEAEREHLRWLSPAKQAFTEWQMDNAAELASMAPEEMARSLDEKWNEIHRGPLGDLERERQAEERQRRAVMVGSTKSLLLDDELAEPADTDVEEITDLDDGINYALLVGEQGMVPGATYVTTFGADGTPTSEVKMFVKDTVKVQVKDAEGAQTTTEDEEPDEGQLHAAAMDEIDWDEVSAAADTAPGDGGAPEGKSAEEEDVDKPIVIATEAKALYSLTAEDILSGDIDLTKLADQNVAINAAVDAMVEGKSLDELLNLDIKAEGGADQNRGNAENLRRSYVSGKLAAQIRWGQDGDFGRCVRIAGKHMTPDQAKGYCNLRHKDALGIYPAQHKSAAFAAAEALADTWNPLVEVGELAGAAPAVEVKSIEGALPGSLEERRDLVRRKLEPMLRALHEPTQKDDSDDPMRAVPAGAWVDIVGTWQDRVIATVHSYADGAAPFQASYEVEYVLEGEDVVLGEPEPVELRVTIEHTGDEPHAEDEIEMEDLLPIADLINITTAGVKSLMVAAPEAKAGRVLSGSNESRLRGAVEHLIAVLAAAGVKVSGTENPGDAAAAAAAAEARDTTAPGTPMAAGTEVKTLAPTAIDDVLKDLGVNLS